jgi:predicted GNAT superfamily acetyltransferase
MNSKHPTSDAPITIRPLDQQEEFRACVALQSSVWQFQELDLIPRRVFTVARAIGGQVMGAFAGDQLVGFAMALPGIRNGHPYLHSHMLAVQPQYRNHGIGTQLKWAQRADALARGIDLIEWTFDPLVLKNAYVNIEKLGAVARRYTPDFYGVSSSALHGGMPTDRLHAEWWLRSERARRMENNLPQVQCPLSETITVTDIDNAEHKLTREEAISVQTCLRDRLLAAFAKKLTVLRFQVQPDGSGTYQLGHWDEAWEH